MAHKESVLIDFTTGRFSDVSQGSYVASDPSVLPNEMRVSCRALLEYSQTDGLHSKTARSASRAC